MVISTTVQWKKPLSEVDGLPDTIRQIYGSLAKIANERVKIDSFLKAIRTKEYVLLPKASEELKKVVEDNQYFADHHKDVVMNVMAEDKKLGEAVEKIEVMNKAELKVLVPIAKLIDSYKKAGMKEKEQLIRYLITHEQAYAEWLKRFDDAKIANDIGKTIMILKSREMMYIGRYYNQVDAWPTMQQPLENYARIFNLMLRGLQDPYLGLVGYFKDSFIDEQISKRGILRSLSTYEKQIAYLRSLELMIEKGMNENDWRDFFKFWNNIADEIKKVREEYGNQIAAETMEDIRNKYHEYPEKWRQGFVHMLNLLNSPAYERRVLISAVKEFQQALLEAIENIERKHGRVLDYLEAKVKKRIKAIMSDRARIKNIFATALRRRKFFIRLKLGLFGEKISSKINNFDIKFLEYQGLVDGIRNVREQVARYHNRLSEHASFTKERLLPFLEVGDKDIERFSHVIASLGTLWGTRRSELQAIPDEIFSLSAEEIRNLELIKGEGRKIEEDMAKIKGEFDIGIKDIPISIIKSEEGMK